MLSACFHEWFSEMPPLWCVEDVDCMTAVSQGYDTPDLSLIAKLPEDLREQARIAQRQHEVTGRHLTHLLDGEAHRDGCTVCGAIEEQDRYKAALERIAECVHDFDDDSTYAEDNLECPICIARVELGQDTRQAEIERMASDAREAMRRAAPATALQQPSGEA